jgi:hypothetical protein
MKSHPIDEAAFHNVLKCFCVILSCSGQKPMQSGSGVYPGYCGHHSGGVNKAVSSKEKFLSKFKVIMQAGRVTGLTITFDFVNRTGDHFIKVRWLLKS